MTHYMELLAVNQPWNLILFMAIPVILAETIAITELYLLYTRQRVGLIKNLNKYSGISAGIYFFGVFIYLFINAVIPITQNNEWRGLIDIIAVNSYLLGVIPLMGITLLELGFIYKNKNDESKFKLHAIFVAIFLLVAHIAMIFGMLNPEIFNKHEYQNEVEIQHDMNM